MIDDWPKKLRAARQDLGLPQAELARLAGVSPDTVRACESARRRPSRNVLEAILGALNLDRWEANQIRHDLGFATDSLRLAEVDPAYEFSVEELQQWVEPTPWPQFVLDENIQVVAANSVVLKLWAVDLEREYSTPQDRNLTAFATNPRFADRAVNWEEMVAYNVAVWKGHHLGPASLDHPSPYFEAALRQIAKGDPGYIRRFLDIWEKTQPKAPKTRDRYRVVWRDSEHGEMRFLALSCAANHSEGLWFHDWVPVDAATWEVLEAMKSEKSPNG
jgi:transcriptional regulator with XRE-family HTH domain